MGENTETAKMCAKLGISTPDDPIFWWSIYWLELHGQRFCVEFGIENAVDKAELIGTATVH